MRQIKLEVYVSTNKFGSETRDVIEIEIPENATPNEIEQIKEDAAREWMYENIEWGYNEE